MPTNPLLCTGISIFILYMANVAETKFMGRRVPHEMRDEIIGQAKARKISKSIYPETIYGFWDRLGRPDIEEMITFPDTLTVEDARSIKSSKPMPPS